MDQPPFVLDLRAHSGVPTVDVEDGDGATLTLHEATSWLRIRSDVSGFVAPMISAEDDEVTGFVPPAFEQDGIAALVHLREHGDMPGGTIGLFHGRLDPDELEAVRAAVLGIEWPRLPRPRGGDVDGPHLRLRYASGSVLINRAFNAKDGDFREAIAPLWTLLDQRLTRTRKSASGTLEPVLEVLSDDRAPQQRGFRFSLRNRSIGPVALTDPLITPASGSPRLELLVGECLDERDWISPLRWTALELPAPEPQAPRSIMIGSRRRWSVTVPWLAANPGQYEVRARWLDYGGPLDPLPGQTPFMPVPSKGLAFVGSGPYPVRGSCWTSARFDVRADGPTR
jgi:hypothetical protein